MKTGQASVHLPCAIALSFLISTSSCGPPAGPLGIHEGDWVLLADISNSPFLDVTDPNAILQKARGPFLVTSVGADRFVLGYGEALDYNDRYEALPSDQSELRPWSSWGGGGSNQGPIARDSVAWDIVLGGSEHHFENGEPGYYAARVVCYHN
jgi:hypothetical protein